MVPEICISDESVVDLHFAAILLSNQYGLVGRCNVGTRIRGCGDYS